MTAPANVLNWQRCPIHGGLWRPGAACTVCLREQAEAKAKRAADKATGKAAKWTQWIRAPHGLDQPWHISTSATTGDVGLPVHRTICGTLLMRPVVNDEPVGRVCSTCAERSGAK